MKNQQSGFTLIELIVVIVILGVLAAVAVPRFVNLSDEAEQAAVEATAGAMGSAMALNYAACLLDLTSAKCKSVTTCSSVAPLLEGTFDAALVSGTLSGTALGDSGTCKVISKTGSSIEAEFTGFYTKP